ncbi:MAG: pilus assembly PilX family protein [Pseudomonadota bacterium]
MTLETGKRRQGGAALMLALIILLVLTLLGVSSMDGSLMQHRMANAQRQGIVALELADAALSEVEASIRAGSLAPSDFHSPDDAPDPFEASTWSGDASSTVSLDGFSDDVAPDYRFFIEDLGEAELTGTSASMDVTENDQTVAEVRRVRIVVRATSPNGNGERLIESFFVYQPDA